MKKKEYKIIENGIEYLVVETNNYYHLNVYLHDKNYSETYIKFIIDLRSTIPKRSSVPSWSVVGGEMIEVYYYKNGLEHNIYGPSFARYVQSNLVVRSYSLYGKTFKNEEDWKKENIIYQRTEKLKKLKFIYT